MSGGNETKKEAKYVVGKELKTGDLRDVTDHGENELRDTLYAEVLGNKPISQQSEENTSNEDEDEDDEETCRKVMLYHDGDGGSPNWYIIPESVYEKRKNENDQWYYKYYACSGTDDYDLPPNVVKFIQI